MSPAVIAPSSTPLWLESPLPEELASFDERMAAARQYVEMGWRLIPFHQGWKKPFFPQTILLFFRKLQKWALWAGYRMGAES